MFIVDIFKKELLLDGFLSALGMYKYYTMQTNLFVAIWFIFSIAFHNKQFYQDKIKGLFKGAVTLYISITFIVFAIALSWTYHPTGFDAFTNIIIHYIIPIAFIIDWFISEIDIRYKWKYLLFWLIYPLCYLVLSVVHGSITGNYLYYFFDINILEWWKYILFVSTLLLSFLGFGSVLILINIYRINRINNKKVWETDFIIEGNNSN
ncbi:MAG: Pr6Pr family membrane protein [Candidatus Heimdallarchaeota archaeon]|nr:Pr6Pr family membrane protein [Candidatus Heimdallarchaeota archaeon]